MKSVKFVLLAVLAMFMSTTLVQAQENKKDDTKKVIILKKTIDQDGNVVMENIELEGDEAEDMEWNTEDGNVRVRINSDNAVEQNIEVIVDDEGKHQIIEIKGDEGEIEGHNLQLLEYNDKEEDGEHIIHLKLKTTDDGEVFEWKGNGELPEDIKQKLKDKGLNMQFLEGDMPHMIQFGEKDKGAFLGVILGQKKEVKEIIGEDGVVNQTTKVFGEDANGAMVLDVVDGSPAEQAGLQEGDIITELDGESINDYEKLVENLSQKEVGDKVRLSYTRDGKNYSTEATLGERSEFPGIGMHKWIDKDLDFDFEMNGGGNFIFHSEDDDLDKIEKVIVIKKMKKEDGDDLSENTFFEEQPDLPENSTVLELQNFEVFPNPTDGRIQLKFEAEAAPTEIMISDASGKSVYKRNLSNFDGTFADEIDLKDFPKGTHILQVSQKGKIFTEKIILQ